MPKLITDQDLMLQQPDPGVLNSLGYGGVQGVDDYASTIQKAVTPITSAMLPSQVNISPGAMSGIPGIGPLASVGQSVLNNYGIGGLSLPIRQPQLVQPEYEQQLQEYYNSPQYQQHPWATEAGRLIGNNLMTAPLFALGGGAMTPIANASKAEQAAMGFAKLAQSSGLMGLTGGLQNQEGNDNTINIPGMVSGAIAGSILHVAQDGLSRWLNPAAKQLAGKDTKLVDKLQQFISSTIDPSTGTTSVNNLVTALGDTGNPKAKEAIQGVLDYVGMLMGKQTQQIAGGGTLGAIAGGALGAYEEGSPMGVAKYGMAGSVAGSMLTATPRALLKLVSNIPLRKAAQGINTLIKAGTDTVPESVSKYFQGNMDRVIQRAGLNLYINREGKASLHDRTEPVLITDQDLEGQQ